MKYYFVARKTSVNIANKCIMPYYKVISNKFIYISCDKKNNFTEISLEIHIREYIDNL